MELKVSVIVAVNDDVKFLEKCLNSLINQTLDEIEILCVNNGSKESSKKICEKLKDERITFINISGKEFAKIKYIALELAIGEFFTFIDPNDWVRETYLEQMYKLCKNKNVDTAICKTLKERNCYIEIIEKYKFSKIRFAKATLKEGFKDVYYNFSLKGKIFNLKLLKEIIITNAPIDQDILMGYLLLKKSKKSIYTNYGGYIETKIMESEFGKIELPSEKIDRILNLQNNWISIIEDTEKNEQELFNDAIDAYIKFIITSIKDLSKEKNKQIRTLYLKEFHEKVIEQKEIIKKHCKNLKNKLTNKERLILKTFLIDYRLIMILK
ncbi:MAG: glycosyltransferase family 2 protein [Sarcina sp.]